MHFRYKKLIIVEKYHQASVRGMALTSLSVGFPISAFSSGLNSGIVFPYGLPFVIFGIMFSAVTVSNKKLHAKELLYLLAFGLFAILQVIFSLFSTDPLASLWRSSLHIAGFILFTMAILERKKIKRNFIKNLIIAYSVTISAYYITNFIFQSAVYGFGNVLLDRSVGGLASLPWGASNTIAAILFFGIITILSSNVEKNKISKTNVALAILIIGVTLTLSRTVLAVVLIAILVKFLLTANPKYFFVPFIIIIMSFIGYNNASAQLKVSVDRLITDRINTKSIESVNSRSKIWAEFINYAEQNPTKPIGYFSSLKMFGYSGHNAYLTTLVEEGVLGLAALICITLLLITYKSHNDENWRMTTMRRVGTTLIFVNLLFEDPHFTQQYILMFWLYCSYIISSMSNNEEKNA